MKKIIIKTLILLITTLSISVSAYDYDYRGTYNITNTTDEVVIISDRYKGSREDINKVFICKNGSGDIIDELWKYNDDYWDVTNGYSLLPGDTVRIDIDYDINMIKNPFISIDTGWAEIGFAILTDEGYNYGRYSFDGYTLSTLTIGYFALTVNDVDEFKMGKYIIPHSASSSQWYCSDLTLNLDITKRGSGDIIVARDEDDDNDHDVYEVPVTINYPQDRAISDITVDSDPNRGDLTIEDLNFVDNQAKMTIKYETYSDFENNDGCKEITSLIIDESLTIPIFKKYDVTDDTTNGMCEFYKNSSGSGTLGEFKYDTTFTYDEIIINITHAYE